MATKITVQDAIDAKVLKTTSMKTVPVKIIVMKTTVVPDGGPGSYWGKALEAWAQVPKSTDQSQCPTLFSSCGLYNHIFSGTNKRHPIPPEQ